jgi:ribonuclease III
MARFEDLIHNIPVIEEKIGYSFKDKSLLILAFVHCSYVNEHKEVPFHNERLEFLGDSVLGVLIAEHLYLSLPTRPEGELSILRSRLVEAISCVTYVQKLNLSPYLLLGKGERMNDGRGRESILADLFEAVIGAIYLDGGLEAAKKFIFIHFSSEIDAIVQTPLQNWKALLQDYSQKKYQKHPLYKVTSETGPDHSKHFKIIVYLNDVEFGLGEGNSKKEAQQAAAADAISRLQLAVK